MYEITDRMIKDVIKEDEEQLPGAASTQAHLYNREAIWWQLHH